MRHRSLRFLLPVLILVVAGCADKPPVADTLSEQVLDAWVTAFNARDREALQAVYAEDCVLLPPPDREIIKGSKAALALFADGMARGFMDSEVNTESKIVGDLAYSYGTYQVHDASGKVIEHGNDIRVWRKINGGWKISREIWN